MTNIQQLAAILNGKTVAAQEQVGVTKMRKGTKRSSARDALQNVSDFVRYLLHTSI